MIRVVFKTNGAMCSEAPDPESAAAIAATAPDDLEVHAGDLLAWIKTQAQAMVLAAADSYGERLTAGYPLSERESWTAKAGEAQSILSGASVNSVQHPLIATEAMFTGRLPQDIAASVLKKAALFGRAAGAISGIRQAAMAGITAAEDEAAVQAALDRAAAMAAAAFAELPA